MTPSLSALTFGIEFEVLLPPSLSRELAGRELARLTGYPVHASYGHPLVRGSWKIVSDGSVQGRGVHGLEFVSPILQGDDGIAQVTQVANALRTMGATVNSTCGLHVHVGNHGGRLEFFKNLVKLYARYEDVLDSLMPATRRANAAQYCRSIKLGAANVDSCTSAPAIAERLARASGAPSGKYHKVNVAPHGKPTVEFRHHAGTVDAAKATSWVMTCLRLVAAAQAGKTGETADTVARSIAWDAIAGLRGKQAHVSSLIARPQGATNEEIRVAFGYATISARKQLRDAGLPYRVTRDAVTGKDRFHAAPGATTAAAPAPLTLAGLADLIGSDDAEREYFSRRAESLAR